MNNIITNIYNIILKLIKNKYFIYVKQLFRTCGKYIIIVVVTLLFIVMCLSIHQCISNKFSYNENLIALTDTIKYYKGKNKELVASKTMLEISFKNIKCINDSLYDVIKSIGVKNPDNVVYIETIIKDEKHDTIWKIQSISSNDNNKYIKKDFDFSNKYRTLKGYVYLNKPDTLGLSIEQNNAIADFTITQKDNNVYITSNNPYIKYNNIIGIKNQSKNNTKTKRFGIGPYIGIGINKDAKIEPTIGIGITWSLFRF